MWAILRQAGLCDDLADATRRHRHSEGSCWDGSSMAEFLRQRRFTAMISVIGVLLGDFYEPGWLSLCVEFPCFVLLIIRFLIHCVVGVFAVGFPYSFFFFCHSSLD